MGDNEPKYTNTRIRTTVISCPPGPHPKDFYCSWQFTLEDQPIILDLLI